MNFRKIVFILLLAFISMGFYRYTCQEYRAQIALLPENANLYAQELQKEDQQLWEELSQYGIDEKACSEYKKQYAKEYKNSRKAFEHNACPIPISQKTLDLIYKVFNEFNINKNLVTIIHVKNSDSPALATDYQLLVDEKHLLQFPLEAQEYTIAHEVQHIIHKDDSTSFALENMLDFNDEDLDNPDNILNKRARFEEKRADVLASLKKPTYAEGNILFMEKLLAKRKKESAGITHPKEKARITVAENILTNYHHTTNKTNNLV